jgi:hypothetical protein
MEAGLGLCISNYEGKGTVAVTGQLGSPRDPAWGGTGHKMNRSCFSILPSPLARLRVPGIKGLKKPSAQEALRTLAELAGTPCVPRADCQESLGTDW